MNYTVVLNFNDGTSNYNLPIVSEISDPKEGMKATIIEGTRGDGAIVIPGGKKSQTISVKGTLINHAGYESLTTAMSSLKSGITMNVATLTLKHWTGSTWANDWQYTVRRITEIRFPESLRTDYQDYEVDFLVLSY